MTLDEVIAFTAMVGLGIVFVVLAILVILGNLLLFGGILAIPLGVVWALLKLVGAV